MGFPMHLKTVLRTEKAGCGFREAADKLADKCTGIVILPREMSYAILKGS